jgi:hypothetical protein
LRDPLPFAAYRNERGEFKHWLHTWTWANETYHMKDGFPVCAMQFAPPAPWLWGEEPDGEFLRATAYMGLFKEFPKPWPALEPLFTTKVCDCKERPVYYVLLQSLAREALDRHVDSMRSRVVNELDLIALSDRHYRLFPTKER